MDVDEVPPHSHIQKDVGGDMMHIDDQEGSIDSNSVNSDSSDEFASARSDVSPHNKRIPLSHRRRRLVGQQLQHHGEEMASTAPDASFGPLSSAHSVPSAHLRAGRMYVPFSARRRSKLGLEPRSGGASNSIRSPQASGHLSGELGEESMNPGQDMIEPTDWTGQFWSQAPLSALRQNAARREPSPAKTKSSATSDYSKAYDEFLERVKLLVDQKRLSEDALESLRVYVDKLRGNARLLQDLHTMNVTQVKTNVALVLQAVRMAMVGQMTETTQICFEALEDVRLGLVQQILADEEQVQLDLEKMDNELLSLAGPLALMQQLSNGAAPLTLPGQPLQVPATLPINASLQVPSALPTALQMPSTLSLAGPTVPGPSSMHTGHTFASNQPPTTQSNGSSPPKVQNNGPIRPPNFLPRPPGASLSPSATPTTSSVATSTINPIHYDGRAMAVDAPQRKDSAPGGPAQGSGAPSVPAGAILTATANAAASLSALASLSGSIIGGDEPQSPPQYAPNAPSAPIMSTPIMSTGMSGAPGDSGAMNASAQTVAATPLSSFAHAAPF